jgi:hypothetical protein
MGVPGFQALGAARRRRGRPMAVVCGLTIVATIGALAAATVGGASTGSDRPDSGATYDVLARAGTQNDIPAAFLAARIEAQGDVDVASLRRLVELPDHYVAAGRSKDGREICQVVALGVAEGNYRAGATCLPPGDVATRGLTLLILGSDMGPWASVVVPDGYSRAIEALIGQGTISDESTSNVLVVPLPESMNRFAGMPEESAAAVLDVELQPDSGGLPRLHVRF